jgi:hypothetical protein
VLEDEEKMGDSTDEERIQSLLEKHDSPSSRYATLKQSGEECLTTGNIKDINHATLPQTF